jgi:hypothetical protein
VPEFIEVLRHSTRTRKRNVLLALRIPERDIEFRRPDCNDPIVDIYLGSRHLGQINCGGATAELFRKAARRWLADRYPEGGIS